MDSKEMGKRRWMGKTPEERSAIMRRLAYRRWLDRDLSKLRKPKEEASK